MGSLASGADRAGEYKFSSVLGHTGPPKTLLEELDGVSSPRAAGELRGVSPLEYSGAGCLRNQQPVSRTFATHSISQTAAPTKQVGGSMGSGSSWDEGSRIAGRAPLAWCPLTRGDRTG